VTKEIFWGERAKKEIANGLSDKERGKVILFLQKRGKEIYFGLKVFFFGENVKNIMKPKAISILAPPRATFKMNLFTFCFTPVDVVRVCYSNHR
jgi:hypothetical protein